MKLTGVPPPQRLILERQMNKSLLIGWVPPDVPPGKIEGYHVYVDGVPKATIKFSERTRALIEGVDSSRVWYQSQVFSIHIFYLIGLILILLAFCFQIWTSKRHALSQNRKNQFLYFRE